MMQYRKIMRDEQHGGSGIVHQRSQQADDLPLGDGIQRRGRLVRNDQMRGGDQRGRDADALLLAARIRILDSFRRIRQAEPDMALIMVSHDLGVVRHIADRIMVLHDGRVEESGLTGEVLDAPRRDYTRELIRAASL